MTDTESKHEGQATVRPQGHVNVPRMPRGRARTPQEVADDIEGLREPDGTSVLRIKTPSGKPVLIDALDYLRLLDDGWSPALRLACPGGSAIYVVTRKLTARGLPRATGKRPKGSDAIVARLVTGAASDEVVGYLNGRYDLRRRSLGSLSRRQGRRQVRLGRPVLR